MAQSSVTLMSMWNSTDPLGALGEGEGEGGENGTLSSLPSPRFRQPPGPPPFFLAMSRARYYGEPVVFVVGMVTNVLTYLVLTRSRFRKVPSVPYLAGIAVADSGFLATYFLSTLTSVHFLPIMTQMGVCQFGTFFNYAFLFLSMWYSVAVVVEKFISVYWPLKKASLCTVFRAKVVLVCVAVMAVVSYSYVIYFFGPRLGMCQPWTEFTEPYFTFNVLDCIVVSVAPLLVIIALVLLIVVRGCEYYRISSASDFGARSTTIRSKASSSSQVTLRATELVFALVGLVLLAHLPNSVARCMSFFAQQMSGEQREGFVKTAMVVRQIHLCSFAVKFFVYALVSRNFRRHSCNLLCNGRDRLVSFCKGCRSSGDADPQRINLKACGQAQPIANACLVQSDV